MGIEAHHRGRQQRYGGLLAACAVLAACGVFCLTLLAEEAPILEGALPAVSSSSLGRIRARASSILGAWPSKMTPIQEWARWDHGTRCGWLP